MKKFNALQIKRHIIINKNVIGINPGKYKHQTVVLNAGGIFIGSTFHIQT